MNYVAVLAGVLIYTLLQLNGIYNSKEFQWSIFFRTNWIPVLINTVIGCAMVFAKKDLETFYPITFITAFTLGLGGQALIKKLSNAFDAKLNTVIGITNEESVDKV